MKLRHRIEYLVRFLYCYPFDKRKAGYWQHLLLNTNEKHLLDHPLSNESVVFDVGGFTGNFSADVVKRYDCNVYIFEPISAHYQSIVERFKGNSKVRAFNFGLSDKSSSATISVNGAGSSVHISGEVGEIIQLVDVCEFIARENIQKIDLMTVNIEGSEYELLPRILDSGLMEKIGTIQIQFHLFDEPRYVQARAEIVKRILESHRVKFSFPFTWECFSKSTI
jgi:FkbM family methyltransferase